jgi:hypothetical protein
VISPNWKYAFHKQKKGYKFLTGVGIGLVGVALPASYVAATLGSSGAWFLAFGSVGMYIAAEDLEFYKWNFDKEITKAEYERLMQKDGNLREFIDKL